MRCNWRRWLWGIIPLLVLSWVAVQAEHGRLERDLAERARLALVGGGFAWATAEFNARDGVLTGRAPQEGEPGKAAAALADLWGVRILDNRATLLERAETYVWSASRRKSRIRLQGYAPSISARQAILGVTRASFPGFEVVDRTSLARGIPSVDVWMAGVSFGLKQLTALKHGAIRMEGLGLAISGEAEDAAAYRAVKQALANKVPKGIKVTSDEVTAPVVSPFRWSAQLTAGRLALTGYVPSEAVREQLVSVARESLPGAEIIDRMEPGDGAPQGWAEMTIATVRELARLEGGSATTKDAVLTFTGIAADGATAEAIRARLRAAVPATFKLNDQMRVKEQPAPAPPPLPPPAPTQAPAKEPEMRSPRPRPSPPRSLPHRLPSRPPWPGPKSARSILVGLAREGQILFQLGSAELDSTSFPTLDKLAEAAKSCPGMHIEVAGHASSEGSAELNQQLSLKRAQSVAAFLVKAGVEAAQLEAIGYGATRPIAPNDTNQNMAKNRRIEFSVRPQ